VRIRSGAGLPVPPGADRLARLASRVEHSFPVRCLRRYLAIRGTDRAVILSGQAFTALFPLLIVLASIASNVRDAAGQSPAERINARFHLSGEAAAAVQTLFSRPPGTQNAITVGSVVLLLASGLSLSRSLQRVYEEAWELPARGVRGHLSGLAALGILLSEVVLLSLVAGALAHVPAGSVITLLLRCAGAVGLWLALQYVLLGGRVPWRLLAPGAVVAGLGQQAVVLASALWMPHLISVDAERYGVIGVSFALLSWLVVVAVVLVIAAVVSVELGRPGSGQDTPQVSPPATQVTPR
jgi:membrane protein